MLCVKWSHRYHTIHVAYESTHGVAGKMRIINSDDLLGGFGVLHMHLETLSDFTLVVYTVQPLVVPQFEPNELHKPRTVAFDESSSSFSSNKNQASTRRQVVLHAAFDERSRAVRRRPVSEVHPSQHGLNMSACTLVAAPIPLTELDNR